MLFLKNYYIHYHYVLLTENNKLLFYSLHKSNNGLFVTRFVTSYFFQRIMSNGNEFLLLKVILSNSDIRSYRHRHKKL